MSAVYEERLAFNKKEEAQALGVAQHTLDILLRSGRLRHVKIDRRILIGREAIRDLLNGDTAAPQTTSNR